MHATDSTPGLPRSVLLALWLEQVPAGSPPDAVDAALAAVRGDDEPHTLTGADPEPEAFRDLVVDWTRGPRSTTALLPAPGDVAGIPAAATTAALEAGECVLVCTESGSYAAVPQVETFGSDLEPGHLVTWSVLDVPDWRTGMLGQVGSLADAERALRTGLQRATTALDTLDVARWRPDAAAEIAGLLGARNDSWPVPPSLDPRRLQVIATATRLLAIVRLATQDDGGAVNLWQADQRSSALREVDRVARRALAAAATSLSD